MVQLSPSDRLSAAFDPAPVCRLLLRAVGRFRRSSRGLSRDEAGGRVFVGEDLFPSAEGLAMAMLR